MTEKNQIKSLIGVTLLTFISMWAFVINLIDNFFEEDFYSNASMLCVVFLFSVIFSVLMKVVKKNWIVLVAGIAILGLIVWWKFDAVAGGCAYCVNIIIEQYGMYFGQNMLYVDFTKAMLRDYDPALFCYLVVILITMINSFSISKQKLAFIPIIFILAALFLPVIIELFPSVFAMLLSVISCIMLLVLLRAKPAKGQNTADCELIAIVFGVAVMIIGGIVSLIKPEDEFEQNEFFPEFRSEIRLFITENIENFQFLEGNRDTASVIGGGALGHVDSLRFSNKEVLKVTLPAVRDKVYIKGYIGAEYTSNNWKEPKEQEKELFKQLVSIDYSPQGMVARYLDELGTKGTLTGIKGKMKVEFTEQLDLYTFTPIYPVVPNDLAPYHDGVIEKVPNGGYIEYFSVPDNVFKVSDEFIEEVIGTSYYTNNMLYAEYVYDNYLEVNTPMAHDLEQQWSKYPIDTATERYNVAYAIREYLNNTCTYTTSPGKVPEGKDFVEYFLTETNEGYCTYFATAAVMMFRSAGIPARYVEGYSFDVSASADVVEYGSMQAYSGTGSERFVGYCEKSVKDSNAHAWVEFYIDGIGWIDFEVTPGNGVMGSHQDTDDYNTNPESFGEEPTTEEPTTEETTTEDASTEEPTTTEGHTTTEDESETATTTLSETTTGNGSTVTPERPLGGTHKKISDKAIKVILITIGAVALLFMVVLFILVRHKKVMENKELYSDNEEALEKLAIYQYMNYVKLMEYIKHKKPDYMTHTEYANYIADNCEFVEEAEAKALATLQERAEYAKELLTKQDILMCKQYVSEIRQRIYESQSFIKKLIFKYIHNL